MGKGTGDDKVLQRLTPRLPAKGKLRHALESAVLSDMRKLELHKPLPGREADTSANALLASLESLVRHRSDEDEAKTAMRQFVANWDRINIASDWRREFRSLVDEKHLDAKAFCKLLEIPEDSPLGRILTLDEADSAKALEAVLGDASPEVTAEFIEQGLAMAQRFSSKLRDPAYAATLVEAGVVDLGNYRNVLAPYTVLERWLPELSEGVAKENWLPTMFERMGTIGQEGYQEPEDGDVWQFIRGIACWLDKCAREYDWIPTDP